MGNAAGLEGVWSGRASTRCLLGLTTQNSKRQIQRRRGLRTVVASVFSQYSQLRTENGVAGQKPGYANSSFSSLLAATMNPTTPIATRNATWYTIVQSNMPRVSARMTTTPW